MEERKALKRGNSRKSCLTVSPSLPLNIYMAIYLLYILLWALKLTHTQIYIYILSHTHTHILIPSHLRFRKRKLQSFLKSLHLLSFWRRVFAVVIALLLGEFQRCCALAWELIIYVCVCTFIWMCVCCVRVYMRLFVAYIYSPFLAGWQAGRQQHQIDADNSISHFSLHIYRDIVPDLLKVLHICCSSHQRSLCTYVLAKIIHLPKIAT